MYIWLGFWWSNFRESKNISLTRRAYPELLPIEERIVLLTPLLPYLHTENRKISKRGNETRKRNKKKKTRVPNKHTPARAEYMNASLAKTNVKECDPPRKSCSPRWRQSGGSGRRRRWMPQKPSKAIEKSSLTTHVLTANREDSKWSEPVKVKGRKDTTLEAWTKKGRRCYSLPSPSQRRRC